MRVITFVLMLTVAIGGSLLGYRLITGRDLITPADLSMGSPSGVAVEVATATTTIAPSPTPEPSPTPRPTAVPATVTPTPQTLDVMVVGNTDGQGVYVRRTPRMADRLKVYPDRARMQILERGVEGDGRAWMKVRAPDGVEGYVPTAYLVRP